VKNLIEIVIHASTDEPKQYKMVLNRHTIIRERSDVKPRHM